MVSLVPRCGGVEYGVLDADVRVDRTYDLNYLDYHRLGIFKALSSLHTAALAARMSGEAQK